MIGIKIKNSFWEKALLALLKNHAEIWQPNANYQIVVSDDISKRQIIVCHNADKKVFSLSFPFKLGELERLLETNNCGYENKFFKWDSVHRQLKNKKTHEILHLTEKESKIIDFLSRCPQKKATKDQLLKNVWCYTAETETHTVESTLYALRQKIGTNEDKLIVSTKTGYRLIP